MPTVTPGPSQDLSPIPWRVRLQRSGHRRWGRAIERAREAWNDLLDRTVPSRGRPLQANARLGTAVTLGTAQDVALALRAPWVDPNVPDEDGETPLMTAVRVRDHAKLQVLLPHADVTRRSEDGHTALMLAAAANRLDDVRALLPGSDPNVQNLTGHTALMLAIVHGAAQDLLDLLLPVSDVNLSNNERWTPLMLALLGTLPARNAAQDPTPAPSPTRAQRLDLWLHTLIARSNLAPDRYPTTPDAPTQGPDRRPMAWSPMGLALTNRLDSGLLAALARAPGYDPQAPLGQPDLHGQPRPCAVHRLLPDALHPGSSQERTYASEALDVLLDAMPPSQARSLLSHLPDDHVGLVRRRRRLIDRERDLLRAEVAAMEPSVAVQASSARGRRRL